MAAHYNIAIAAVTSTVEAEAWLDAAEGCEKHLGAGKLSPLHHLHWRKRIAYSVFENWQLEQHDGVFGGVAAESVRRRHVTYSAMEGASWWWAVEVGAMENLKGNQQAQTGPRMGGPLQAQEVDKNKNANSKRNKRKRKGM